MLALAMGFFADPASAGPTVQEIPIETAHGGPFGVAAGPGGTMWFTESYGNNIGRITDKPVPEITLQPDSGPPGTVVQVTGSGFGSFEKVKLTFIDSVNGKASLGKATTDATGHFSKNVTIPANATQGPQTIKAKGHISSRHVTQTFTVT